MATEQPACGLGSLLSMTCRDRAEAFARSLQSRLQTLGLGAAATATATASVSDSSPTEGSPEPSPPPAPPPLLGADAANAAEEAAPPPARPPLRLGSSSDSDLFYDFDLDPASPASPASPAEEALELVVDQQPRPAVEPESGCTSSFLGTSPGSDSSDSCEPNDFMSPSLSPAWSKRRGPSPPSYAKCNGHAVRLNGSAHIEKGAVNLLKENSSRDYGSTHSQIENESLAGLRTESQQTKASALSWWEDDAPETNLDNEPPQSLLANGSAHMILRDSSAQPVGEDLTRVPLQNYTSERVFNRETPSNEEGMREQSNDVRTRNAQNFERANDLEPAICYLESVTLNEPEESDSADFTLTENETDSEHCLDITSTESASLYVSQDDEIDLLPSETLNDGKPPISTRDTGDDGTFAFSDWEDRFSDYCPGDPCGLDEQESKDAVEEHNVPENENLSHWSDDASYQSTFTRAGNLTLECPQSLASEIFVDEDIMPFVLDTNDLLQQSSWETQDAPSPRLINTLIINREDNLKEEVQVPEVTSSEGVVEEVEDDDEKDDAPVARRSPRGSPPPLDIREMTPDDEESDEEESSLDESEEKVKPEPRRRPKPEEPEEAEGVAVEDEMSNDEEEESPRQRLRRCSSLKTGKTPPGTPHRKKIVRFADVLGLDLADVRTFLDEIPRIPSSAYDDLRDVDLSLGLGCSAVPAASAVPVNPIFSAVAGPDPGTAMSLSLKTLMPTFQQPGGQSDFLERIRTRYVCLENAAVSDAATSAIAGMVRVRNLDFHKSVFVRYSIDGWKTFSDLQATYVPNSCDVFSDKFSFVLFAHTLTVGQRLEFAVRFQCKGTQYWDSNGGANYVFQCLPATSSYMPLQNQDDRWSSFY